MPVPLVALAAIGIGAAMSAWQIYQTDETTKANDKVLDYTNEFYSGAENENSRFWQEYIRRHHLEKRSIMYPYRTGYNFNRSSLLSSEAGLYSNSLSRQGSYVYGVGRTSIGGLYAYRSPQYQPPNRPVPMTMYG